MKKVLMIVCALMLVSCNSSKKEVAENNEPTNADRVKALYDAFAEGDVPTVLAGLTEDVNWNEAENFIYNEGEAFIGHDAVVNGVFARLGSEWEYWNLADKAFMNVEDNMVLVTGRYQAKNKASGKVLDSQFAHLWTMKDSLASKFQQYTDTKQAAEVVIVDTPEESED